MQASWLRSSPSFIIGIILIVGLGGLYVWRWGRPHPRGASDVMVREFVARAQAEVRTGRRAIDRAADKIRSGVDAEDVQKAIEAAAQTALEKVEAEAEAALSRLEQLDDIALKTEQNRRNRIRNRLREMREAIAEAKKDAVESVRTYSEDHSAK